jgi:hypothetical protein
MRTVVILYAFLAGCGSVEIPSNVQTQTATATGTGTATQTQPAQPPVVVNINNTQNNGQASAGTSTGSEPMCVCDPSTKYCYSPDPGVECPQIYRY